MGHLLAAWDASPLWGVLLFTIVLVLLSIEAGYALASRRRALAGDIRDGSAGAVGALLGLLAFLLALTFSSSASRFDARRQLLLDEVNAIGTTWLRAGLVADPQRSELRQLLRKYVSNRVELARNPDRIPEAIERSEALHEQLWAQVAAAADADPHSEIVGRLMESTNEVIDLHTNRVTFGTLYRIPIVIWAALYVVAVLSMTSVGFQFGLGGSRNLPMSLFLALTFSAVIGLIADLDRATEGLLQVNQQPMLELHENLSGESESP